MHVLVVTCAHRGDDARIVHRQARSLLQRGHRVTLVAPAPSEIAADPAGLERVVISRAVGRRRVRAWRDAMRAVRGRLDGVDLVLLHDPELVPLSWRWRRRPIVWDVHEDFAASVSDRSWIPAFARTPMAAAVGLMQRWASRRLHIVIAEDSYAATFPAAPVVPNSTWMPSDVDTSVVTPLRLVYVGRLSRARGLFEMIEIGSRLRDEIDVVLVGSPDADVADAVARADADGVVRAVGPLPNPEALALVQGSLAGLSLLHDIANYRHSRPTKIAEYLANGVPVITTPLPLAEEMVTESGGGVVVAHGEVDEVAAAVVEAARSLARDLDGRREMAEAGRRHVAARHSWDIDGERFVDLLESWARSGAGGV